MKKIGLIALLVGILLNLVSFTEASNKGTFAAFGPKDYTQTTTGEPTTVTEGFSVLNPKKSYTLYVYNGGKYRQFEEKVSSAVISLNGIIVVKPDEFKRDVSPIRKAIKLSEANKLSVELYSKAGSGLTIEIIGRDSTRPTIVAAVMPPPNDAGWNNTDVTVSFACSDKTSEIASCPGPVLVEQEGANQVITGTATDTAGNTASASVTVNLDKTPPVVTILSADLERNPYDPHIIFQGTANDALSGVAAFTCNGTPVALSGSSFTCNVPLVYGQAILEAAATDVSGNTGLASKTETYLGYSGLQHSLAIVNVIVSNAKDCGSAPAEYTGLAWGQKPTNPYIPNKIGTRVCGDDVNVGIGGSRTTVWVKYDYVDVDSYQRVLVDYGAFHWPNWNVYCPPGWEPAQGTSSGIQGALTTGTKGACDRIGLCVKYAPMNQTDTFITNVGLSYTYKDSEAACPAWGEADHGHWPMQADTQDIHQGCSDKRWMFLCYGKGEAWPPMPTSINPGQGEKLNLLETYAPRVWLAQNESYWPSSVNWAFQYLERFGVVTPGGLEYWVRTKEPLSSPSSVLPFFRGCDGHSTSNPCTIAGAPVYAFWVTKSAQVGGNRFDFVDLVYFFYYPYNRGKEVADTIFGNHVSDWEHITVRLSWVFDDQTGWSLKPVQIYLSIHDFGYIYEWDDGAIPKIDDTHPVVYSAWGSHGVWPNAGPHKYGSAAGTDLVDQCSQGTAWDTWHNVGVFDYNQRTGLSGTWPRWMDNDFTNPGNCGDPSNPACGAIYRWGNPSKGCTGSIPIVGWIAGNYCILENGPTGPVSKNLWDSIIMK